MRKTPSYLKGLAETRARASADVLRYQRLQDEIGQKLVEAQAEVEACDRLILKFDNRLNPELIQPIKGWKGRYGKRGALLDALKEILQSHAPEIVTTDEIVLELRLRFNFDFSTKEELSWWQHNSVRRQLNRFCKEGLVECLHSSTNPSAVGHWRWKSDAALSLDHLRELAAAQDVAIHPGGDSHE